MFYKCQPSEKDFEQLSGISWGKFRRQISLSK